ncbi:DUF948 domain-containing protein [Thalassobacillus pellis]|uniref:DUF948 domain-containing protein n=1 Tax=Thalassobacillus pellis TaxID=748008 RepID=UPI001961A861|nr:DUF948 domain-containing protein [Thalassobacillus pellis]MBM7554164.1 uncharacterized protein YoxC [Thalassobacillus pellis]
MDLVYIGTFLAALAFAFIVIFIVITLHKVTNTIESLDTTMDEMERQMNGITTESEELIKKTHAITDDLHHKIDSTDSLFDSLHDVGKSVVNLNHVLSGAADNFSYHTSHRKDDILKFIHWGEAAAGVYATWKMAGITGQMEAHNQRKSENF